MSCCGSTKAYGHAEQTINPVWGSSACTHLHTPTHSYLFRSMHIIPEQLTSILMPLHLHCLRLVFIPLFALHQQKFFIFLTLFLIDKAVQWIWICSYLCRMQSVPVLSGENPHWKRGVFSLSHCAINKLKAHYFLFLQEPITQKSL